MLSIRPFRRLWIATSLSSLGDWLSLLALTAEAAILAKRGIAASGAAVSGVWLTSRWPQFGQRLHSPNRTQAVHTCPNEPPKYLRSLPYCQFVDGPR